MRAPLPPEQVGAVASAGMDPRRRVIGLAKPRLSRKEAWGEWRVSLDRQTLVCVAPLAGNYQVSLVELKTAELCQQRVAEVVSIKGSWVDQRVLDDLCRALKAITGLPIAKVDVEVHRGSDRAVFDAQVPC